MEELVRRGSDWRAVGRIMRGNHTRNPSSRPTSKILCPALTCVTRATAELPLFHGVSRKKLRAWPATQMQSGGGIAGTGNQQAVDGDNRGSPMSTCMRSTGLIACKEPGYKVAWIKRACHYVKGKTIASLGLRASTTRVGLPATCG
jgi:hypothetical protein